MKKVIILISYSLGLLFMYAAGSKLAEYDKFVVQIGQSAMLTPYAGVLAWLVPVLEIVIAIMLVFPGLRRLGLYGALGMMAGFTAYIYVVLNFMGNDKPCSCGGVLSAMDWPQHLVFNIVFTVLAGVGVTLSGLRPSLPGREREKKF
ncbi:MauE/DoxX family redox-associated membrane protein [Pedobacter africanus]|uniref:Membrane protein YphA (DoxX/SURF4 family) n=1 Tax=Pedobacter africanus TaxID=151894 RepID=A0ACC6KYY4_9SPHI|nr:MauE/DoxX family redox-associated membrane protein [Pedobacter africanus]MDR6784588.1 putative membrane protein YphA (DoxX/SURF4 family) [Pedobacter africanus]